jgi:hypothetical protein
MATIAIKDLQMNRDLDRDALASIKGGGAPWVFGWIRPHVATTPSFGTAIYQITNNFHADQMINQFQIVDVVNSAPGATISVALDADAELRKQLSAGSP